MDISDKTVWQIAAGDSNRNFARLCLDWDVVLNGPGYMGPWPEADKLLAEREWTSRKRSDIGRFAEEVKPGDIVVLRLGTSKVHGVGEVVGPYLWSDLFGDIDGWDLQHVRRVRWFWRRIDGSSDFNTYDLKLGDTTQKLESGAVFEWIKKTPFDNEERDLRPLPAKVSRKISIGEIAEFLFDKGISSAAISELTERIDELIRIASWYQRTKKGPSESETIAYLIVPLLRALGWTPQRMAVEWHRVDLALFDRLPREDENLRVVVEAKKMDYSCLTALSQAETYAKQRASCRRLIVTDGTRYGVFLKEREQFQLYAYMNLTRFRDSYPVYGCRGVKEVLLSMTADWNEA